MTKINIEKKKANSEKLAEYKQIIISNLITNEKITTLLDSDKDPDELLYVNIFPFGKIIDTAVDAMSYVTVEIDMPHVSRINNFYKEIIITLTVVCHDNVMQTDMGVTRMDALGIEIEKLFTKARLFGLGDTEIISNTEGAYTPRHSYRQLRFKFSDLVMKGC